MQSPTCSAMLSDSYSTLSVQTAAESVDRSPSFSSARSEDTLSSSRRSSEVCTPVAVVEKTRWCNFMFSSRCPFCVNACGTMESCKFMHLDDYSKRAPEERKQLHVPNLMTRHTKILVKDLQHIVDGRAAQHLNQHICSAAWGCPVGYVSPSCEPFKDIADELRALGWTLAPVTPAATSSRLSEAPYAQDVATIMSVVAWNFHYDVANASDIIFKTVSWALQIAAPALRCREVDLEDEDIMQVFAESLDTPPQVCETSVVNMRTSRRARGCRGGRKLTKAAS